VRFSPVAPLRNRGRAPWTVRLTGRHIAPEGASHDRGCGARIVVTVAVAVAVAVGCGRGRCVGPEDRMTVGVLVRVGALCVATVVPGSLAAAPATADVGFRTARDASRLLSEPSSSSSDRTTRDAGGLLGEPLSGGSDRTASDVSGLLGEPLSGGGNRFACVADRDPTPPSGPSSSPSAPPPTYTPLRPPSVAPTSPTLPSRNQLPSRIASHSGAAIALPAVPVAHARPAPPPLPTRQQPSSTPLPNARSPLTPSSLNLLPPTQPPNIRSSVVTARRPHRRLPLMLVLLLVAVVPALLAALRGRPPGR
jgi:hypothetical protein